MGLQKWKNFENFCGTFFIVPEGQKSLTISPSYKRTDGQGDSYILPQTLFAGVIKMLQRLESA